jgi:asparagine synthase (glutamine-hydrolysing)
MCGIVGSINLDFNIEAAKKSLYHRGPDAQNHYQYKNIKLLHTRLSIQDIAGGCQPFIFQNYAIVFNGEIYNHLELRKTHLSHIHFTTLSDTETLLHLYLEYKHNALELIDGMFAFCIFNSNKHTMIIARDRAGKKPLYYYKKDNTLLFVSELNAMKTLLPTMEINSDAIYSYLRNGYFVREATPYKNVSMFSAGYIYEINCDNLEQKEYKYFDILNYYQQEKITHRDEAINVLDAHLHKSVKDRLLSSDIEVGAFLSGGIDSSLIVAIASEYTTNLKTFTVKFDGGFNESHLAKLTAQKYNTHHREINISMNLTNDIEKILLNYGEPFMDSSAIPSYYVSSEAKKYVSVVLNGDGADELFAGYRRYVPIANNWIKFASYFSFLLRILPKAHNKQSAYNYTYRLLAMSQKQGLDFYNSATTDIFEDVYSFDANLINSEIEYFLHNVENEQISSLSKILYQDFNIILHSDLLKKMDIATMSHSLEGRSPFLSKYLLEFAPTLSDTLKIKKTTTKYILRELAKKYLPKQLINQPKRGFEVPLKSWVNNDLKENIFDSLSINCYSESFIPRTVIHNILQNTINISQEKRAKILWSLFCLETWHKNQ